MIDSMLLLGIFVAISLLVHLTSTALAYRGCRQRETAPSKIDAPMISIVRPVCGLENHLEETLRSGFLLNYWNYELIFCIDAADDPAIPLVRRLMAQHSCVPSRLLIGRDVVSPNPKLNNVVKGWRAAAAEWIVLADSNVMMPPDYLQRLASAWDAEAGLVCSPPIGSLPGNLAAEIECGFLNTYQARWQYAADRLGFSFAQGKTMLWRKADLDRHGGPRALADELAEDAAATKLVRRNGKRVRLATPPFEQPLGARALADVWRRQVRWARLRRDSFPLFYALEIGTSSFPGWLAAIVAANSLGVALPVAVAFPALWYGAEAALARASGWHVTLRSPITWIARDVMLPAIWVSGWIGSRFVWRGNQMQTAQRAA
ncbi:hypothetical protein GJW-30_1_02234 [Variibacter gotjawalensis]|uniref:Ceramide glucosyltransferase n=1 Tax=Variibacter gotjawalensis TaxID=1333996 RepID=A0A0S3PUP9_9BRAD|nr:ceramide glucosyltransferase [Variibacter gotjawalensis]NIK50027.1 ceramide glucosyltransferase [Variibacter gotjawalensis]RZS46026.1 ceramide glucosyltransferase [Variibacter gotjawalensis]BAT59701.1 hypothetical protein GJW-30_1_02234 [Variibacter gotjawalensis]